MSTVLLAVVSGAVVGVCLGALGGGGGILVWPALVFGIGVSAQEASLLAKMIVGSCALYASLLHWRQGTVNFRVALAMAAAGMLGAMAGGRFIQLTGMDRQAAEDLMYGLLAGLMVAVSVLMLRKGLRQRRREQLGHPAVVGPRHVPHVVRWGLFVLASVGIGFLTGFLGVGGGFMIVPTLVLVFRLPMNVAAGTSLLVIALNCASGILASSHEHIRWDIALLFAVSSIVASTRAVRASRGLNQSTLQIAFAGLVVVLGAMMVWKMAAT